MGSKLDRFRGRARAALGHLTRNQARTERGRREQFKGDVKAGVGKAQDAAKKL